MPIERAQLGPVVDLIIPRDGDPGALDLGTLDFVVALLGTRTQDAALIARGLDALDAKATGGTFAALSTGDQQALLEAVESEPWFVRLVTITTEGFYADPGNGGNAGARSWEMIGYRHGLPEGPSGPPERPR
jgi:hypothetical protein